MMLNHRFSPQMIHGMEPHKATTTTKSWTVNDLNELNTHYKCNTNESNEQQIHEIISKRRFTIEILKYNSCNHFNVDFGIWWDLTKNGFSRSYYKRNLYFSNKTKLLHFLCNICRCVLCGEHFEPNKTIKYNREKETPPIWDGQYFWMHREFSLVYEQQERITPENIPKK